MHRFVKGLLLMGLGLFIMSPLLYLQYVVGDFDSLLWLGWIGAVPWLFGMLYAFTGAQSWIRERVYPDMDDARRRH